MESEFLNQVLIAQKFYSQFMILAQNPKSFKNQLIVIEHDKKNNFISCRSTNMIFPNNHDNLIYSKVLNLFYEFIISKKYNLYKACQEIFPLIEIICNYEADFTLIKPTEITERTDIKLLNNTYIYKEMMDLMQSKFAATDINFYYSDTSIDKLKFKLSDFSNELIQIDYTLINNYFHNIRVFLSILVCNSYYLIKTIQEKCAKHLIYDNKEGYYGFIQMMNGKLIKDIILETNLEFFIKKLESHNEKNIDLNCLPKSDLDIINWIEFISNSYDHLKRINSDAIKYDFEKFCLLTVFAYSMESAFLIEDFEMDCEYSANEKIQEKKSMILKLIDDCFQILKIEIDFSKKISDWELSNYIKIFNYKQCVDVFILSEIHVKTVAILKEKSSTFSSISKIKEYMEKLSKKVPIKNAEIADLCKNIKIDVEKISKILKFLKHTSWTEKNAKSMGDIYKDLLIKQEKLEEFRNQLIKIIP